MKILAKFKNLSLIKKILCIILVIGVLGVFAGGEDTNKTESGKKDNESQETNTEKKINKIGEIVKVGDVDYLVNHVEVTKTIGDEYLNTSAQDTYLVIDVAITNNEKEALSVSDSFFILLNGENEYSADSGASIYLGNDSLIYEEVNPGVTMQGKIIFDVPEAVANSGDSKLQVQTGAWGTEKDIISLAR